MENRGPVSVFYYKNGGKNGGTVFGGQGIRGGGGGGGGGGGWGGEGYSYRIEY